MKTISETIKLFNNIFSVDIIILNLDDNNFQVIDKDIFDIKYFKNNIKTFGNSVFHLEKEKRIINLIRFIKLTYPPIIFFFE